MLTSDGEFHSARRQFARWAESGDIQLTRSLPNHMTISTSRFLGAAGSGEFDLILISRVMFNNGQIFHDVPQLAAWRGRKGRGWRSTAITPSW